MRRKLLLPGLILLLCPAPSLAQKGQWQAVAYSASTGQDGYAFDFATRAAAEATALEACRAKAGAGTGAGPTDCALTDAQPGCLVLTEARDQPGDVAVTRLDPAQAPVADQRTLSRQGGADATILRNVCAEKTRAQGAD